MEHVWVRENRKNMGTKCTNFFWLVGKDPLTLEKERNGELFMQTRSIELAIFLSKNLSNGARLHRGMYSRELENKKQRKKCVQKYT